MKNVFIHSLLPILSIFLTCLSFVNTAYASEEQSCVATSSSSSSSNDKTCNNSVNKGTKQDNDVVDCNIYMAPSTIGNYSNYGIFTAKRMKRGEVVPYPEIVIPLAFRIFSTHPSESLTDGELWDRYIWEQFVGEIEAFDDLERDKEKASVFIPGVGCTINSMLDLSNIKSAHGSKFDEIVPRTDPAAGAFTPYYSCNTTISVDEVEAGQELFANYGDEWIPWIPNVAVTFDQNFAQADELMQEFELWIEEHEADDSPTKQELSDELLEAMWKFMVDFPHSSRPLSVLPKEWNRDLIKRSLEKEKLLETGTNDNVESPSTQYWADKGKVSLDFLKEHGKCQDHMRPGISTIPNAGRGAFASRNLPKGTVVGYAPLIHVAIRGEAVFNVTYDGTIHGHQDFKKEKKNYTRPDLVVNYSFGHENSTLLLTPYGAMVNYINHKSLNDGDGPNVRLQWPTRELVAHNSEWLTKDIEFLRDTVDKIGLSFDYVALRDIKEGEEIFLDYGDSWVKAWEEHVRNWSPPEDADSYVHSSQFHTEHLRTSRELEQNPYPWNLHTLCSDWFKPNEDGSYTYVKGKVKTEERFHCRVMKRTEIKSEETDSNEHSREKEYLYTVTLEHEGVTIVVKDVPRGPYGVNLYDKAYSQMWHMKDAFRHKMYIPDDIFPKSWMNL